MKPHTRISLLKGAGIVLTLLFIAACHTNVKQRDQVKITSVIKAPFKSVDVVYASFTINPAKQDTLVTRSGSRIIVPAEAMTDSAGVPVTEFCTLLYREFMNVPEILASGIPMNFKNKSANLDKQFTSAGMFELKGKTKTGKPVFISNKKPIVVELASNNGAQGYSNFYLNPQTGDWIYNGEEKIVQNEKKITLNKQIDKLKQALAFSGKNYFALNSMDLLDVYMKNDYTKIHPYRIGKIKKLPARLLQYGVKSSDMYSYSSVICNKVEQPANFIIWENMNGKPFPSWTKNKQVKLTPVKSNVYELEVIAGKKEIFKTTIKALMTIKHLFSFGPEYWTTNYDEAMRQIKEEELRLGTMNEVYRTLQVNSFGIYNCDKFYNQPEAFIVDAQFNFPGNPNIKPDVIYYVSKKDKSLITYSYHEITKITLCNDATASLVTVLPGNILAEVTPQQLNAVSKSTEPTNPHTFSFKVKTKINSMDDVKKALGI